MTKMKCSSRFIVSTIYFSYFALLRLQLSNPPRFPYHTALPYEVLRRGSEILQSGMAPRLGINSNDI